MGMNLDHNKKTTAQRFKVGNITVIMPSLRADLNIPPHRSEHDLVYLICQCNNSCPVHNKLWNSKSAYCIYFCRGPEVITSGSIDVEPSVEKAGGSLIRSLTPWLPCKTM